MTLQNLTVIDLLLEAGADPKKALILAKKN